MRAAGSYRRAIIARPPETARGVAAAESQMAILQREVFLVERLDREGSDQLMHMKAVCLVSPAGRLRTKAGRAATLRLQVRCPLLPRSSSPLLRLLQKCLEASVRWMLSTLPQPTRRRARQGFACARIQTPAPSPRRGGHLHLSISTNQGRHLTSRGFDRAPREGPTHPPVPEPPCSPPGCRRHRPGPGRGVGPGGRPGGGSPWTGGTQGHKDLSHEQHNPHNNDNLLPLHR